MCHHRGVMEMFSTHLRQAISDNGVSVRGLAREWRPSNPEAAKRSLLRYLSGEVTPTLATRNELAAALRVPVSTLPLGSDTEEAALVADLMAAVRRLEVTQHQILDRMAS